MSNKFSMSIVFFSMCLATVLSAPTLGVPCNSSASCGNRTNVVCSAATLPSHCACNKECMTYTNRSCVMNRCYKIEDGECKKDGVPFLTGILTTVFVWYSGAPFFIAGTGLAIGLGVLAIVGCCCSCCGSIMMKSKDWDCVGGLLAIVGSLALLATFIVGLVYFIDPFDKLPNGCYAAQSS